MTKPAMRSAPTLAILLFAFAACKEDPPATTTIKVDVSRPTPQGDKLSFDLLATNQGQQEATVYVFIAAYNMAPKPPTRGIWPPEADPELGNSSHELIVAQYKRGFPIKLGPGATLEAFGTISAPAGRSKFDMYQVVIFDDQGRKVRDNGLVPL